MAELTPMKRQYYEIKQRNPDCLLFFRLGDFYEMFDDDARLAARELDLTLTTRDRNVEDPAERTPMCGVPYHSAEAYIGRLIAKGYKVAICEQMEDPALAKGLVERDIIRIITPGTVTESSMLEENKSNYLCAVYLSGQSGGTAFCDLSTGEFCAANYPADAVSHILNELGRFAPREAVCADAAAEHDEIRTFLTKRLGSLVEAGGDRFEYLAAAARVCEQFGVQSTDALGLGEAPAAVCAAGALLAYLLAVARAEDATLAHGKRRLVTDGAVDARTEVGERVHLRNVAQGRAVHVFQQRRQIRQLRAAQGQRVQVAPVGRAVHRAGDETLHVADLAQAADELAPQDVVARQLLHCAEAAADLHGAEQRTLHPCAQQAAAHGRFRLVQQDRKSVV